MTMYFVNSNLKRKDMKTHFESPDVGEATRERDRLESEDTEGRTFYVSTRCMKGWGYIPQRKRKKPSRA